MNHARSRSLASRAVALFFALALAPVGAPQGQGERVLAAAQRGASPISTRAKRVLVVSIDGLDARYLLRRDEFKLKIPTLRRLLSEGVAAEGVVSVYPSVTYPAHTTMVTGVTPRRHGIYTNDVFEPPPPFPRWHWFAREVRVDALWDAAARARLKVGLVSWPVSTGAGDWNVPEIWKPGTSPSDSLAVTLAEMKAHERPRGLIEEVGRRDPSLYAGVNKDEGDDMRVRFAAHVIREKRPEVMLVHLFDLDHFQHDAGPFTPEAFALLEKSDAYLARLLGAAADAGTLEETSVFVVSDHGFLPVARQIHPIVLLARAGLIRLREERDARGGTRVAVADWRALAQPAGGSCAVRRRDRRDGEAMRRALAAFREFGEGAGGGEGILRVVYAEHLDKLGADPRAAFYLEGAAGHSFAGNLTGEAVTPDKGRGAHGFLPLSKDYRASFVASGAGVARRGSLGHVQMLDIGPTIAAALGLKLRDAQGRAQRLR